MVDNNNKYFMRMGRIRSEVLNPDNYGISILHKLKDVPANDVIEFMQGNSVMLTTSVKQTRNVIGHVNSVLGKNKNILVEKEELEAIEKAAPWDFWKTKQVQDVINKLV